MIGPVNSPSDPRVVGLVRLQADEVRDQALARRVGGRQRIAQSSGRGAPKAESIAEDDGDRFGIDVNAAAEDPGQERRDEIEGIGDRHPVGVVGLAARQGDRRTGAKAVRVPGEVDAGRLVADVPFDVARIRASRPIRRRSSGCGPRKRTPSFAAFSTATRAKKTRPRSIAPPRSRRRTGSTTASSTSDCPRRPRRARRRPRRAWTAPGISAWVGSTSAWPRDGRRRSREKGSSLIAPARIFQVGRQPSCRTLQFTLQWCAEALTNW